jgi:molybdate transport system substrate-binding protein
MVIGESIAQVNQYVSSKSVQLGLTSRSVLSSSKLMKSGLSHEVDKNLYEPIEQVIVILKRGAEDNPRASALFQAFMFSPEAQKLLSDHGYQTLGDSSRI